MTKKLTQSELKRHAYSLEKGWHEWECQAEGCTNTLADRHVYGTSFCDNGTCSFVAPLPKPKRKAVKKIDTEESA